MKFILINPVKRWEVLLEKLADFGLMLDDGVVASALIEVAAHNALEELDLGALVLFESLQKINLDALALVIAIAHAKEDVRSDLFGSCILHEVL